MIYKIGVVEDNKSDINRIDRVLYSNSDVEFEIFSYGISDLKSEDIEETLLEMIINDINEERIDALIIDYKIMTASLIIEGSSIFRHVVQKVPMFPVIILTEIVDKSQESEDIDATKVFRKEVFFDISHQASKDLSRNLFKNMEHYKSNKEKIKKAIEKKQNDAIKNGIDEEAVLELVELEEKMSQFEIDDRSNLDHFLNKDNLKDALKILTEIDEITENEKS
ncbi:hypothetical protein JZO81_00075 [Enterococcus hulanensis]|uniref:hypothetical protein n=1 Tax=Enterococcus hulanensis TaxID=2559929 RepID=UPI001A90F372|nr:hypothetical protein [Enterococcus hulanensis]MBO0409428.1 hypothetical protein [Enterococcus hulanensis]